MVSGWVELAGCAAVPAAVLAAFALLRRRLPSRSRTETLATSSPGLVDSCRRAQWYVGFALILVGAGLGLSLFFLLAKLNQHYADAEGPAHFQLLPTKVIWSFLPGFAALSLSWEITLMFWSWVGNRQFILEYLDWSDRRTGFDSRRALRWLALW